MRKKFYMSLASLVVAVSGVLLFSVLSGNSQAALPRDCDSNAIINCGAITPGELTQRYNENKTGDLKAIYDSYGISSAMIAGGAGMGEVHKDGRVTLNGQTVATGATSIGRQSKSGSSAINIGGKTYYQSPPSTSFARESITAYVFLDKDGRFIGAILTSCGNPVRATPPPKPQPKPEYKCVSLTADKIKRNEYSFKATATATGGATIESYSYDFGDGKSQTLPTATTTHTYDKPGEYLATLTVNVKVDGQTKQVTDQACKVKVTVKQEASYSCDNLSFRLIQEGTRNYAFDLKYSVSEGASLKTVDFDFGDGQTREDVAPSQLGNVTHTYSEDKSYTAKATLHFTTGDDSDTIKDDACEVALTISPKMCPQNPSLPENDSRCGETLVQELPKTGPTDLIFGGLGLGSIAAAGYYWYASRRGLLAAWLEL
jgi:hypothetical protein